MRHKSIKGSLLIMSLVLITGVTNYCEEDARYYGCTDDVTVTYSDGRKDTSYRRIYLSYSIPKGDPDHYEKTKTETVTIENGVVKTITTIIRCTKNPGAVEH